MSDSSTGLLLLYVLLIVVAMGVLDRFEAWRLRVPHPRPAHVAKKRHRKRGGRSSAGQPRRPYNVCSGRAYSMRALLDILLSLARVTVRVEVDPARLRPSDNPIIGGSHARLTADTGWTPVIPIEQTLADLLDYWRRAPDA